MSWLPGWNSPADTEWWNSFYFWLGIGFLVLLAASEVASHFYGLRKDELVATAEHAAAQERQRQQKATEQQHQAETAELQRQTAEARQALDKLGKGQAWRRLTEEAKDTLVAALKPFPGTKIDVWVPMGNDEAKGYATDFIWVFRAAGWDAGPKDGINQAVWDGPPGYGVQVTFNRQDANDNRISPANYALMRTLIDLGLTGGAYMNDQTPPGGVEFRIRAKPPP